MSENKLMAQLVSSKNWQDEADERRYKVVSRLKGRTVRIQRGNAEFWADVEKTTLDRIFIHNPETGKRYWVYATDVAHVLATA